MRRRTLMIVLGMMMAFQTVLAQNFTVKGTIISKEDNEPLIGVAIRQLENPDNGVITDFDGNYAIEVTGKEATLSFTYLGMQEQQHKVTAATKTLNIEMLSDAQMVEEVVVVAYGVRKKGTIAGSVGTVKADKIAEVPAAGFDQALQGQTAGLTVLSNSGEPSKAATFQIRGTNSINSGTAPLFILDGVPISSSDFNTISPSDIESVSVLKDASSTSIYGARAANGVVVITTKRGTQMEKPKVTLRAQAGFSQLASSKEWTLMNTAERIQFEKELGLDKGQDYDLLSLTDVNWQRAIFNNRAMLQNYDFSVSRATERMNYFVSANFYDQDGIALGSTFRRYSLRSNADVKAGEWLKMGTNTMLAYEEVQQADEGAYTLYTPISASRFMLPYWNPYREDGSIASSKDGSWTGTTQNPIEWMQTNPQLMKKYKVLSTIYAEATPVKNLTLRSQLGIDFSFSTTDVKSLPSFPGNNGIGTAANATGNTMQLTATNTANYKFDIDHIHDFNFLLGQEGVNYRSESFQVVTRGQNNDFLTTLSNGTYASSWANSYSSYAYLSFFGRGEYNYMDKYYADFSLRTDASSRFGKNGRWAGFWSVGLMWNVLKEKFMRPYTWITNAQVALSTGTSGNSSIPNYDHLALVGGGYIYNGESGIAPSSEGNPDLSWEQLWSSNLALHLGFLHRFNVDIEFYNKLTTDMLMLVPQSYANNGFGQRWDNVGAMVNRGVELSANLDVIRTEDFVWNISGNASYNHNEITELYNGLNEYEMSGTSTKLVVGHPVGEFYINRYAGVNPANGDALWYDKEGNITTEFRESDKVLVGKTYMAPWQGGFGTSVQWKGWAVSTQFAWVANRWMFNNDRFFEESNGLYTVYNQSKRLLYDRWKKPGDITDIPRYGVTPQMDSRFLEDASFLRMKNLMLSYTLQPSTLAKLKGIGGARLYVQGQNLFTFTRFSGIDPESTSNVYAAQYPMSRQFSMGIELSF
ncbi:MAG: TonB-dependent receptor [Bacteroidaceae bacterium]|nr:TonB-dependent receptor [Bacteroidaceae bacterium]